MNTTPTYDTAASSRTAVISDVAISAISDTHQTPRTPLSKERRTMPRPPVGQRFYANKPVRMRGAWIIVGAAVLAGCSAAPESPAVSSPSVREITGSVVPVTVDADRAPANIQSGSVVRIVGVRQESADIPLSGAVVAVRHHADRLTVDLVPQNFGVDSPNLIPELTHPAQPLSLVQVSGPIIATTEAPQ